MSFTLPDSLLKSAAFGLFLEEIAKHMSMAEERMQNGLALDADECRKLGAAFHTIRGSAGFFNLQDVSNISKQLEDKLLGDQVSIPVDVRDIRPLVEKLKFHTDQILSAAGSRDAKA